MKNIRRVIAIFLLLIIYAYIVNIANFPSNLLLYSDSSLNLKLCPFLKLEGEVLASSTAHASSYNLSLNIGNTKLKTLSLKVADKVTVVPVRKINRVKTLYSWSNDCAVFQVFKI
jgi:hypothetical protein